MTSDEMVKRLHRAAFELEPLRRQLKTEECREAANSIMSAQRSLTTAAQSLAVRAGIEQPVGPHQYRCVDCGEIFDKQCDDYEIYGDTDPGYVCEPCMRHRGY